MNFLEYYGLKEDPFKLSPDPDYFYLSASHRNALSSINYMVEHREGFCMVSGEPGTGKTTLLKVFMKDWNERADIALVTNPRLDPKEFLEVVLEDLGVKCGNMSKVRMLKAFRDFLLERFKNNRPVIIIVDEAQETPEETLEELRLLSNLETEKEKLLQVVLVGQPKLVERLSKDSLRQFDQRIAVRAHLTPLSIEEIAEYLSHRLKCADSSLLKLDESMTRHIYRVSQGVPRIVNVIASRTIMSAYIEEDNVVTTEHMKYAIEYLDGGRVAKGDSNPLTLKHVALAVVCFMITLVLGEGYLSSFDVADTHRESAVSVVMEEEAGAHGLPESAMVGTVVVAKAQSLASSGYTRIRNTKQQAESGGSIELWSDLDKKPDKVEIERDRKGNPNTSNIIVQVASGRSGINRAPRHDGTYSKESADYKPVSVKIPTVNNVEAIVSGSTLRVGVDLVYLDGFRVGTRAPPNLISDHMGGTQIEDAVSPVDDRLHQEGIRNEPSIIAAGGIRCRGPSLWRCST